MMAFLPAILIGVLGLTLGWIIYTDIRFGLIRNVQNLILLLSGIGFHFLDQGSVAASLIGSLFGGSVLLGVFFAYRAWRGRDGIGMGDVKFMIGAGAWVFWYGIAPLLVLASLLAVAVLSFGGAGFQKSRQVRFGPFLAAALIAVFALQERELAPWALL